MHIPEVQHQILMIDEASLGNPIRAEVSVFQCSSQKSILQDSYIKRLHFRF